VGVIILNSILDSYINQGIDFIRPASKSIKLSNQVYYTSVASYINMALIPLLTGYNWKFEIIRDVFGEAM
jgi:hypothetical protein